MKTTLALSVVFIAVLGINAHAQKFSNPFRTANDKIDVRKINQAQVSGKTTAIVSRLISEASSFYDGSSFQPADSTDYIYAASGLRGFYNELFQQWDYDTANHYPESGSSIINSRYYTVYNTGNKPVLMVFENWDGASWGIEDRVTLTYDASGNLTGYMEESDRGLGVTKEYNTIATYNSSNQLITATEQEWDGTAMAFEDVVRTTYVYNSSGNLLTESEEDFDGISWNLSRRNTYTYDANDNNTQEFGESYHAGTWEPSERTTNTFNASNDMIESMFEVYSFSTWTTYGHSFSTYDANHNEVILEYHTSNGTTTVPDSKTAMTYNSYNQMLIASLNRWNTSTAQFDTSTGSNIRRNHYEEFSVNVKDAAKQNTSMTLYPVPAANFITLKLLLNNTQAVSVIMQDMTGKVVKTWNENVSKEYSKHINTSNLAPGNYVIKVIAGTELYLQKVTITH